MNEAGFWATVVRPALHQPDIFGYVAWKVPAETRAGLPDVWWSREAATRSSERNHGWLELKYVPAWPVRVTTPVTVEVRPDQLAHLREAHLAGAAAGVLLGVAREVFLLSPRRLLAHHRLTHAELMDHASSVVISRWLPTTRDDKTDRNHWLRSVVGAS